MAVGLPVFFLLVVVYALSARRLERWLITMPMFFVVVGALFGDFTENFSMTVPMAETLTEVTLALLLFADAATIGFRRVAADNGLPDRLLFVGLPLSMIVGGLLAFALFPGEGVWFALMLAAILAPTDAALGLSIFNNQKVPVRIRRALNVESGLNDGIVTPFVTLFLALAIGAAEGAAESFLRTALTEIVIALVVAVGVGLLGGWLFRLAKERNWSSPTALQIGGLALALTAFLGATASGGNGFIAAFVAGLLFGYMVGGHAHEIVEFTEIGGTLLSLFVWTTFCVSVVLTLVQDFNLRALLFALLALTLMRMLPVFIAMTGAGLRRDTVAIMGWFGPRGLASVVFTLMAIESYHHVGLEPDTLTAAAGWTILLSVFLHGITAQPLANWYARRLEGAPPSSPEFLEVPEVVLRRSSLSNDETVLHRIE
jgi:NhaP-type Na+/H+ or K+/H+ antiporter